MTQNTNAYMTAPNILLDKRLLDGLYPSARDNILHLITKFQRGKSEVRIVGRIFLDFKIELPGLLCQTCIICIFILVFKNLNLLTSRYVFQIKIYVVNSNVYIFMCITNLNI